MREIKIEWEGQYTVDYVIKEMDNAGDEESDWSGNDYGLYQIYGRHILCGKNTLLYLGKAIDQTFAQRFKQHKKDWIGNEKVKICLGRTEINEVYSKADNWKRWKRDISIAEQIIIYKYTPNYNSSCIGDYPKLSPYGKVRLIHIGSRGMLRKKDNAPRDYR